MVLFWQETKMNQLYRSIIMKNGQMVSLGDLKISFYVIGSIKNLSL